MLFLVIVAFALTGAITFYHFKKENEQYHIERLERKEQSIQVSIAYFLAQQRDYQSAEELVSLFDEKICELADVHDMDLNIYSLNGQLLISSLEDKAPIQLSEDLLRRIESEDLPVITTTGRLENRQHLSTFDYIRDYAGIPVALINLPYSREDQAHLYELKKFLRSLAEIYLILFAAAALSSYIISNYITASLEGLRQKLRATRLNRSNKPLEWEGGDEIGALVKEYNRMLKKLEESAIELARTERDHAWKEMARQVAHEIKNPLTPMRLQLQMMERGASEEQRDKIQSLLGQVDTLSDIAQAFSSFATMPELVREEFNLLDVVHSSVSLFEEQGASYIADALEYPVRADRAQWLRLMNNLLKNAVQAIPDGRVPSIQVELRTVDNHMEMTISDNGSGISPDQLGMIFEPQFTTKSGGMGLGLAMVKRIVQQSGGQIQVQNSTNEGTRFWLSLDLVQKNKAAI
jgi:signal transduction histidine kinase